ncbi:MAG TPA: aldehyde dehydrogenase family protein [Gaiellaceae bacterium]|nr:aldehyde dehydrogenase family protein [Gaiellaceae bacterium]
MITGVIEARHYVDGEWLDGDGAETIESHATTDGELLCRAPVADEATVDAAVAAARRAFEESGWKERRAADRAAVLLEVADRVDDAAEDLAVLVAREMGKPIRLALDREIRGAADKFRYFAGAARAIEGEVTGASPAHILDLSVPYPIGVCALVIPWNDPVDLAVRKLGAALAAGCTAVVKPSEETPASTEALIRLFDDLPGLPPGVVNMVHGPGRPTGEALVSHPQVDKVSFTGSTGTGRRIMELAAGTLKRVSLECGGKAPCLVFADAYLEKCLDALSYGAFLYGGQSCTAATRIIVERPLYDTFVAALAERARTLPAGNPLDRGTLLGPLVSERQVERVRHFLDGVEAEGGTIVTGGGIDGLFVEPTIVTGVSPDAHVASEEVFGPVVCVFAAADEDEAVRIANGVRYGLGASVWTSDVTRALRVVRRLDAGDVWVNTHYVRQAETPFGGWKESGVGRELGMAGMREYLAYKRIAFDTLPEFHLKTWFEAG